MCKKMKNTKNVSRIPKIISATKPLGVSVIICCHNSAILLPETLRHLKEQVVFPDIRWEVIVVDNASTDETSKTAYKNWPNTAPTQLKIIFEPRLGLSIARHRGIAESTYEFIVFLDDDNRVDPNWMNIAYEIMVSHLEVAAAGGLNKAVCESEPPEWFHRFSHYYAIDKQGDKTGYVCDSRGFLWGAGLVLRRSAYEELAENGFIFLLSGRKGDRLDAGEDSELCLALRLAGWKLWYDERLRLEHYLSKNKLNWTRLRKMVRGFGRSSIVLDAYYYFLMDKKPFLMTSLLVRLFSDLKLLVDFCGFFIFKAFLSSNERGERALKLEYKLGRFLEIIRINVKQYKNFVYVRSLKSNLRNNTVKKLSHKRPE
jgi:glycosyltransferase involved in cell wall biosynthesis